MVQQSDSFTALIMKTYKDVVGKDISEQETRELVKIISAHRDLALEFADYPENVMADISRDLAESKRVYYPCDVVELRDILEKNNIFNTSGVAFFDYLFCKKYFVDRPLVLSIARPVNEISYTGSIIVSRENPFYIKYGISCVYVREDQLSDNETDAVYTIIKECSPETSFHRIGDIPSTREPKMAKKPIWSQFVKPLDDDKIGNWYGIVKKADASSSEDPGASYYEGRNPGEDPVEITLGPNSPAFPFTIGDKVRLRYPGWGFEHVIGRVAEQDNNIIKVEWETGTHKGKTLTLDMNDPVKLFGMIEKV